MNLFKYETHSHTREASACGSWSVQEAVDAHIAAGYAGLILTNHFFYGNTCVPRDLPWSEWVRGFCAPYNIGKEYGDKRGFQVFFGWESGYNGTEFLIYGLSEDWLLAHPEIRDASVAEQFTLVHDGGGMIIHPHPFRKADYISEVQLFPEYIDGVEIYNACHESKLSKHYQPESDEKALAYAREYGKVFTAGSDVHGFPMLGGGMVFDHRLADIQDFCSCVLEERVVEYLSGNDEIVLPGKLSV